MSPPTGNSPAPPDITLDHASTLLRLGLTGPRRPVDDLIDRLQRPDGAAWLERALARIPACGSAAMLLGHASVKDLTAAKEHCKLLLRDSSDPELRLAAIAGYFLSIAAGLRHHGVRIGGQGRAELSEILLDLAAAAPPAWRDMLAAAAMVDA
jgi:hypothetical protein